MIKKNYEMDTEMDTEMDDDKSSNKGYIINVVSGGITYSSDTLYDTPELNIPEFFDSLKDEVDFLEFNSSNRTFIFPKEVIKHSILQLTDLNMEP